MQAGMFPLPFSGTVHIVSGFSSQFLYSSWIVFYSSASPIDFSGTPDRVKDLSVRIKLQGQGLRL